MKKRNKKYKPRAVNPDGGLHLIGQRMNDTIPLDDDQVAKIGNSFSVSMQCMISGAGTEEHWCMCVSALNLAMMLAELKVGDNCIQEFQAAIDGAMRAGVRNKQTGKWAFDGDAIRDIQIAFTYHNQQLALATPNIIKAAIERLRKRYDERDGSIYQVAA